MKKMTTRSIIMTLIFVLMLTGTVAKPVNADVPSLDQIRVALYVNLPKYSSITKSVTLSSESAFQLGVKSGNSTTPWLSFPANNQIRLSTNDFKVNVFESTTYSSALQVFEAVKKAGGSPFIISMSKSSKQTYQVLEGSYATSQDATAAATKWKSNASISSLLSGTPMITGPLAYESGSYAAKADALAAAANFGAQGLNNAIGVKQNSEGKIEYTVIVGMVGTAAELELVKVAASKVSSSLTATTGKENTIIMRMDHTATASATAINELYLYNPQLVVTVKADNSGNMKVSERSERSYRGTIELGSLNNDMYVVNELPFEQYLYSVVAIEMYPSWPLEALKAQAVAARTYALYSGDSYVVGQVVDTTSSQAYYGVNSEHERTTQAVNETKGQVITYNGKLIETVYSSNAGGKTADAQEIWGNDIAYLKSVSSPDQIAEKGLLNWYRVVMPDGKVGYIREDLVTDTGQVNPAGRPILRSNTDGTNIRRNPIVQTNVNAIAQINSGVQLIGLEKVIQSNPMTWRRGPYTSNEVAAAINSKVPGAVSGAITSMEVTKVGTSNRVLEISVNGKALPITKPLDFRSALGIDGSLQSTLFTIEQTGKIVILGANQSIRTKADGAKSLQVVGANGNTATVNSEYLYVLDGSGNVRTATGDAGYQYNGTGFGHGVGMSQYGAYGLAEQGYDYDYILKYYYKGTTITKDE